MKKALKCITGFALPATLAFSGIVGFAGKTSSTDTFGCLTSHADAHSCGQSVDKPTAGKNV